VGVLHQPLAPGPCTQGGGLSGPSSWGGVGQGPPGRPTGPAGPRRDFRARAGDRAPPRGVDVKATPAGSRFPGPGAPRGSPALAGGSSRIPDPGSRIPDPRLRSPEGSLVPRTLGRCPSPLGDRASRGLFYINPSRRGPAPGAPRSRDGTSQSHSRPPRSSRVRYSISKTVVGGLSLICFFELLVPLSSHRNSLTSSPGGGPTPEGDRCGSQLASRAPAPGRPRAGTGPRREGLM